MHGGLTKRHLEDYGGIQGMNDKAREWFEMDLPNPEPRLNGNSTKEEIIAAASERAKIISKTMPPFLGGGPSDRASPVWMRDYSKPNDVTPSNSSASVMLTQALDSVGNEARRMVVGHTPQSRINSACEGRVWRIDVGMSGGVMNNVPEVLEITHGEVEDEVKVIRPGVEGGIMGEDRLCGGGGSKIL